jgi:hypothetical protein
VSQVTDKLYHNVVSRVHLAWEGFELTTLVVIGTDCIGTFCSYKFNYHTTTTAPSEGWLEHNNNFRWTHTVSWWKMRVFYIPFIQIYPRSVYHWVQNTIWHHNIKCYSSIWSYLGKQIFSADNWIFFPSNMEY